MNSILQSERSCYICKSTQNLEMHHIFPGPNRNASEEYGLKVWLCHAHHYALHNAPNGYKLRKYLQEEAQKEFEKTHTRKEFMEIFHKNYL